MSFKNKIAKKVIALCTKHMSHDLPYTNFQTFFSHLTSTNFDCNVILDIGAHEGKWSKIANSFYSNSKIYLFEPQKTVYQKLLLKSQLYNENWITQNIAIGSKDGNSNISIWKDSLGSSLLPPDDQIKQKKGQQYCVPVRSLDSLFRKNEINQPDLIKIDVQGFELEVLKGAQLTLENTQLIIIECSLFSFEDVTGQPELIEVINFMYSLEYVIYDFAGFLRRPLDNALGQCDIVFIKRNHSLRQSAKWD